MELFQNMRTKNVKKSKKRKILKPKKVKLSVHILLAQ